MEGTVEGVPDAGLHARPASRLVQTADRFDNERTVGRADGDDVVAPNSMLAVTGVGIQHGRPVRITNDDAAAALNELEALVTTPIEDEGEDSE